MPSNLAVANAVTKIGYDDIHDQLDDYIVALQFIERGAKYINDANQEVQFAAKMGRTRGIGARKEGENLPTAGQGKNARASLFLKYQYGTIEGTGQVFKQVTGNATAFVDWMKTEMEDIKTSLRRDLNRQVYGDGTGTLAVLTAGATTATTMTLDDVHFLEVDMTIDVLTQATLGNAVPTLGNTAELTITAINTSTKVVTVTGGTVTAAIGSAVVLTSNGVNNWKKEWEGLGVIIGTGILHNIDPSTFPKWVPGYIEGSVGTLAEIDLTHLTQGIHQVGGAVTDLLTTYGVVNAYWNTLQGLRRYDGSTKLVGGDASASNKPVFQSIFGDVPITADWAAPAGYLAAINKKELYVHQLGDWDWMDKDASIWKQVSYKDAYRAHIFQYSNIGTFRRNSHGKLTGITEV